MLDGIIIVTYIGNSSIYFFWSVCLSSLHSSFLAQRPKRPSSPHCLALRESIRESVDS